jgi:hypothetical protein
VGLGVVVVGLGVVVVGLVVAVIVAEEVVELLGVTVAEE